MADSGSSRPNRYEQRKEFVRYLYELHADLSSANQRRAAEARGLLARLRRGLAGPAQQLDAYSIVLAKEPPPDEEDAWYLTACLFALHLLPAASGEPRRSVGAAMGKLRRDQGQDSGSISRRFTQLLSVGRDGLPHHLRQAVTLLRARGVSLGYDRLLDDLVALLRPDDPAGEAQRRRLRWARDFHRSERAANSGSDQDDDNSSDSTEPVNA